MRNVSSVPIVSLPDCLLSYCLGTLLITELMYVGEKTMVTESLHV